MSGKGQRAGEVTSYEAPVAAWILTWVGTRLKSGAVFYAGQILAKFGLAKDK